MGDIKKQRKKFNTPRFPWRSDALQQELRLLGQYGLRNKRELWRHETILSHFRGNARSLIGQSAETRKKTEDDLLNRLKKLGILEETAVLDDVLDLAIEDILERRLHTIVFRRGLAKTVYQARQLISHGHIAVGDRRVTVPGYLVAKSEENTINYVASSALSNLTHPLRQAIGPSPTAEPRSASQQPEEDE